VWGVRQYLFILVNDVHARFLHSPSTIVAAGFSTSSAYRGSSNGKWAVAMVGDRLVQFIDRDTLLVRSLLVSARFAGCPLKGRFLTMRTDLDPESANPGNAVLSKIEF
jgi:hypothetical protein